MHNLITRTVLLLGQNKNVPGDRKVLPCNFDLVTIL